MLLNKEVETTLLLLLLVSLCYAVWTKIAPVNLTLLTQSH